MDNPQKMFANIGIFIAVELLVIIGLMGFINDAGLSFYGLLFLGTIYLAMKLIEINA